MKLPTRWFPTLAALGLLLAGWSLSAQQPPPGPRGPGGPGGRGGPFGPQLPPEQQAEVDRLTTALEAEARAVTLASSNLVAITFTAPTDKSKITLANEALTKARSAWAAKASQLFAETQASEKKLSQDAINRLVVLSSGGRGGRGGPPGFGGPGGAPPPANRPPQ